ncbi:tyrosine-type recombinase/integrase [Lentibacillus jeotgali]|uniref:tyrosine-type recombinase/integrase n=1 Tax=Lentibacillus jeotgali TaxID=558169 RepID=UPI00026287D2|nr:tyrosine-type recombinase/integrase [Lentibacillus jeotgali]
MKNNSTGNEFLSEISISEFITLFEDEMKKLDYCHDTIHERILMIKRAYSGSTRLIDQEEVYSSEKLYSWLTVQKARLATGDISHERYLYMQNTVDFCEEIYHFGGLERRGRHRKYTKYIPECYKKLQKKFLQSLSSHLAPRTLDRYELNSRQFWIFLEKNGICDITDITSSFIEDFLSDSSKYRSIDKDVQMLKRLFIFLNSEGYTNLELDFNMLKPAGRRKSVLPHFSHEDISKILATIDTSTRNGKRDYAIITLAVYTGLRSSDIYNLKLKDIDWNNNDIKLKQGKTGNTLIIPLSVVAGNAVADYILNGRPNVNEEWIFLRNVPPYTRLEGRSSGNTMLKRHLAKIGWNLENTGKSFHALRRSVGSWMSKEHTPLPIIAEFLGHSNTEATKSYLSYDEENMRKCCLGLDDIPVLKEELS